MKQFLKWCVRKDYLTASHRLFEAEGLVTEASETAQIDYYRPAELRTLLEDATEQVRVVIALQAFAGLRLQETLRLDWRDVFGTPGHIEVSTSKSKTRQRRLVEVFPALEQWLAPYSEMEGRVTKQWTTLNSYVRTFVEFRSSVKVPARRNGLRHAFVTYHFALHSNENLTAALAGNSPAMIHTHYKGLATRAEAEKWFNVMPAKEENVIPLTSQEKQ